MAPIPRDLNALLTALRAEGVPVGPGEVARLAHAFDQGPLLDRRGLRELLACTLVKGVGDRAAFDILFDAWCPDDGEPPWLIPSGSSTEQDDDASMASPATTRVSGRIGLRDRDETLSDRDLAVEPPGRAPDRPKASSVLRRRIWVGSILGLVLIAALLPPVRHQPTKTIEEVEPPPAPELMAETRAPAPENPMDPTPVFWTWVPREVTLVEPPRLSPATMAFLGGAAWLAALLVYIGYRRRRPRPIPDRPPARRPGWVPLARAHRASGRLIDTASRRQLVWNVGRFESEELTRRVDLAATAAATARAAGSVEIRRERAVYPREIWLWEDELCTDPALPALAAELVRDLRRAGLIVRRGGFTELPHRVCWSGDDCIQPLMVEGHQRTAMVALLTDGEGLEPALESGLERRRTLGLLAGLRHWPRLVFVDFSSEGRVASLVEPLGLACIRPEGLHRWLGGESVFAPSGGAVGHSLVGEERLWAAACALGGRSLAPEEALAMHAHLGLRCPTWSYRRLVADAGNARLAWSAAARCAHVNWLIGSERLGPEGGLPESSRLRRVLDWWRRYLERDADFRRRHEGVLTPWRRSPARRERALELALLDLFADPAGASRALHRLARAGLAQAIRERLAGLAARDQRPVDASDRQDAIYLPWTIAGLPPAVQVRLRQLGFGGDRYKEAGDLTRTPGRLGLVLAALATLGLAGMAAATWHRLVPAGVEMRSTDRRLDTPLFAAQILRRAVLQPDGRYRVTLGTARRFSVLDAEPGEHLTVDWSWQPEQSETRLGDWLAWRAGTRTAPVPSTDPKAPERSVVLILGAGKNDAERQLALRLLDTGSAQAVAFVPPPIDPQALRANLPRLHAPGLREQFLMMLPFSGDIGISPGATSPLGGGPVIGESLRTTFFSAFPEAAHAAALVNAQKLAAALDFSGWKPIDALSSDGLAFTSHDVRGTPMLRGNPGEALTDPARAPFVALPGGTFTMGSPQTESGRDSDEGPQHEVRISPFAIMATEVTNAQYAAFLNDIGRRGTEKQPWLYSQAESSSSRIEGGPGDWRASKGFERYPAVTISWYGAKAFCEHYGARLPTEAEWEYAARAGTTTAWSFGADEADIDEHAWYGSNWKGSPRTVATRKPNPWGLYDMHGNLWEWVSDWYGPYPEESETDPTGPPDGEYRVLRGGSFVNPPEDLRSAGRDGNQPGNRGGNVGFRCARAPSPSMGLLTDWHIDPSDS